MFELPNAKRVRRDDLSSNSRSASPNTSSEPDIETERVLKNRLAELYGPLPDYDIANQDARGDEVGERVGEEELDFRLFSSVPTQAAALQGPHINKIILEGSDDGIGGRGGEGRFLHARPRGYYLVTPEEVERRRREYVQVAIGGQDILKGSTRRHWGLEVPWRVIIIEDSKFKTNGAKRKDVGAAVGAHDASNDGNAKKGKPSKKKRILLRQRRRLLDKAEESKKVAETERERREREKKTRRNREKQLKRRMKEKAAKAGAG